MNIPISMCEANIGANDVPVCFRLWLNWNRYLWWLYLGDFYSFLNISFQAKFARCMLQQRHCRKLAVKTMNGFCCGSHCCKSASPMHVIGGFLPKQMLNIVEKDLWNLSRQWYFKHSVNFSMRWGQTGTIAWLTVEITFENWTGGIGRFIQYKHEHWAK